MQLQGKRQEAARARFRYGGEPWRRRQWDEELASWSLPNFFIQRGSFIAGEIMEMVAAVGVGEDTGAVMAYVLLAINASGS
jgi:hypothetical protein